MNSVDTWISLNCFMSTFEFKLLFEVYVSKESCGISRFQKYDFLLKLGIKKKTNIIDVN